MTAAPLVLHAGARGAPALAIEAEATVLSARGTLVFEYRVRGDIAGLRIPPVLPVPAILAIPPNAPGPPDSPDPPMGAAQRADGLWRHTCFEAFVRDARGTAYTELNFSPSTCWAIYAFDRYREGMRPVPVDEPPQMTVQLDVDALTLRAVVTVAAMRNTLPAPHPLLALSAVIEDRDGGLSYWALAHPPGKPDFHHDAGFVMNLEGLHP